MTYAFASPNTSFLAKLNLCKISNSAHTELHLLMHPIVVWVFYDMELVFIHRKTTLEDLMELMPSVGR